MACRNPYLTNCSMPHRELLHWLFALSPSLQGYTNSVYVRRGLIGVRFNGVDHKTVGLCVWFLIIISEAITCSRFSTISSVHVSDQHQNTCKYYLVSSTIIIREIAK